MAVKVMWAPALRAQAGEKREGVALAEATTAGSAPQPRRRAVAGAVAPAQSATVATTTAPDATRKAPAPEKPKRRKASVYDADGNEVFITLLCLKCRNMRPLSAFGLRRMADGAIRNQPWCRGCRSDASPKRRRDEALAPEAPIAEVQDPRADESPRDAGFLAAQVATALIRGRG